MWQTYLTRAWLHRGLLACALWPLSWLYGGLLQIHRHLSRWRKSNPLDGDTESLQVPVVVVGNVVAGGVGKTPIVMALVDHLQQQGWQVGVISRGYGRIEHTIQPVTDTSTAPAVGDEPLLIARKCRVPVWVGAQRLAVAQALLKAHPQVNLIVSDDGLQHTALPRRIELCVFDERGIGNGWLLPAGPLREPWPRIQQAPYVFQLQTDRATDAHEYEVSRQLASYAMNGLGQRLALSEIPQAQALAGIAKPHRFFAQLQAAGVRLVHTWALTDHASMDEMPQLVPHLPLLCTEKDAVKLWLIHPHAWAVPLVCTLPTALTQQIDAALRNEPVTSV
jgi:tetraacyldisaccharide 4'-kinase